MKEHKEFIAGYLSAVQNLAPMIHDTTFCIELIREGSFLKDEWLSAQNHSGYRNDKMLELIELSF